MMLLMLVRTDPEVDVVWPLDMHSMSHHRILTIATSVST